MKLFDIAYSAKNLEINSIGAFVLAQLGKNATRVVGKGTAILWNVSDAVVLCICNCKSIHERLNHRGILGQTRQVSASYNLLIKTEI